MKKRDDSVDIDTKDAHHKTKDKSEDDVTHDKSNKYNRVLFICR